MVENTNRTHFIMENKYIKRKSNNLELYNVDKNGIPIAYSRTSVPIKTIDELYILKKSYIDSETIAYLADNNIVIHFNSRNQRYVGSFYPSGKNSVNKSGFVLLQQARAFDDEKHRLYIAKQITFGHFKNMLNNLKFYKIKNKVEEKIESLKNCKSINEIMGVEGSAKKEYYENWNKIINNQKSFKFVTRTRRPPADKINVLISYLNSRIYSICLSEIYKTELDPRIGFLHEPNRRSLSLHLDIAEIFKPLIGDRVIFKLLNRNIIKDSHFEKDGILWKLTKDGIKIIELEIISKLSSIRYINDMKLNYRYIILKEINNLKRSIVEYTEYIPYSE